MGSPRHRAEVVADAPAPVTEAAVTVDDAIVEPSRSVEDPLVEPSRSVEDALVEPSRSVEDALVEPSRPVEDPVVEPVSDVDTAIAAAADEDVAAEQPTYGVVVLTQGKRPNDLERALTSLLAQTDVELDVVVVGNPWKATGLPDGVRSLALRKNKGIPGGRNAGVPLVSGDLLFFLDDDASLPEPNILARMAEMFEADPKLGLIQPRVVDPDGAPAPRRWTPRLMVGDPGRSSHAMNVWEGAIAIRREAFEFADGWPSRFFYAHEGIELAWRVWDAGFVVRYAGDIDVHHPAIAPTRHAEFYRFQARNRVWLARRNLPWPVSWIYVFDWAVVGGMRLRSRLALSETFRGYRIGVSKPAGKRRPMSWRTIWRMTKAGHPPII